MLTRDDLSAIKKVVKEEVQGVEERQAEKDNGLEERLTEKIQGVEERLGEKISKVQETIDIVQNVVVKHYGELEQRVASIEEELRNPRN